MIHDNAFLILNAIFETARHMEQISIPISQNKESLLRLVNKCLVEQFDRLTKNYSFMTEEVKHFCHNLLVSKIDDDDIDDTGNDIEVILSNDILSCSDMLFATTIPKGLPDNTDPYLREPQHKWFQIKGGSKRLGYVVMDPIKMGYVIIQTSNLFRQDLRNNLATNLKFIMFVCEKITDLLLKNEDSVNDTVSDIMQKIMVICDD